MNSIELAIFSSRLNAICQEMGFTLQRSALSPNIKDRLDFSCAIFDCQGHICAQAAHIPVHLGSMAYAMQGIVSKVDWQPGDMLVLNDPFMGGTHLPDVTVVAPVYVEGQHLGFVVNRAHHANIGSASPGSMPLSSSIEEEGVVIQPVKLMVGGKFVDSVVAKLAAIESVDGLEKCSSLPGDFHAQVSANLIGCARLQEWVASLESGSTQFFDGVRALNAYGRSLAQATLLALPDGEASFEDCLDNDGFSEDPVRIAVRLTLQKGSLEMDFAGTSAQVAGNVNCPFSVCMASVYYVFACLLPDYAPCCQGAFDCLSVEAPAGSVVNALPGAAVAAGNVETSMRIVDVVMGALKNIGVDMPAASQGTMNNVAMGAVSGTRRWDYYETIAGGEGANSGSSGRDAIHTHMTNTLNTPVESLELHYPLRIEQYSVRRGSGGSGRFRGGNGLVRCYRFMEPASVTLLTDRRKFAPWGVMRGESGVPGENALNGEKLSGKAVIQVQPGDILSISSPGGGGWGARDDQAAESS